MELSNIKSKTDIGKNNIVNILNIINIKKLNIAYTKRSY